MALHNVGQPEDVAAQVVVLASDVLSGHVGGQLVTVADAMEGRVVHDDQQSRTQEKTRAVLPPPSWSPAEGDLPSVPDPELMLSSARGGTTVSGRKGRGPP